MNQRIYNAKDKQWQNPFSILALLSSSNNWSLSYISYLAVADTAMRAISLMHFYQKKYNKNQYMNVLNSKNDTIEYNFGDFGF